MSAESVFSCLFLGCEELVWTRLVVFELRCACGCLLSVVQEIRLMLWARCKGEGRENLQGLIALGQPLFSSQLSTTLILSMIKVRLEEI